MKRLNLRLAPLALLAVLLGSGCVIVESQADMTFQWDFEGFECYEVGVNRTFVQIWDGDYLEHEEYVPCDANGLTVEGFAPGDYSFYLAGLSPTGLVLYEAGGDVHAAAGSNEYNVRLLFAGH